MLFFLQYTLLSLDAFPKLDASSAQVKTSGESQLIMNRFFVNHWIMFYARGAGP